MRALLIVAMAAVTLGPGADICRAQAKGGAALVHGKTIDGWIKEMNSTDHAKAAIAIQTIVSFGPDKALKALPDMIIMHKKSGGLNPVEIDPSVRLMLTEAIGVILAGNDKTPLFNAGLERLIASLNDRQYTIRIKAMEALQQLGHHGGAATTEVIALARDKGSWELRRIAITTLQKISDEPIKADIVNVLLIAAETDPCYQVRLGGLEALIAARPRDKDKKIDKKVIASMVDRAERDSDPLVKLMANLGIIMLSNEVDNKSVDRIVMLMKHSDAMVRLEAIKAAVLVSRAKSATVFIPDVVRCLDDEDITVQLGALQALGACGKLSSGAVKDIVGRLDARYKSIIQIGALSALGKLGYVAAPAVEAIVRKVSDPDPDIQATAINALGDMGGQIAAMAGPAGKKLDDRADDLLKELTGKELAGKAVPVLIRKLDDPNPNIRLRVMQALGKIGDERAIAPLLALAADRNPNVQSLALQGIALMGPKAAGVVPQIIPFLDDKELGVRLAAVQALGSIRSGQAVDALTKVLADPNQELALMAVAAIGTIGKDAAAAVKRLEAFEFNKDPAVRAVVIQAYGAIRSREAINALGKELSDKNVDIVYTALSVIGMIGPDARNTVPSIRPCVNHKDNRIAYMACNALLAIGPPDAAAAVPDLQKLAADTTMRPSTLIQAAQYVSGELSKKDKKK